jgi:hypothetical protein
MQADIIVAQEQDGSVKSEEDIKGPSAMLPGEIRQAQEREAKL